MNFHDLVMILVMTFPMFLFTIYPGIALANYLDEKYKIQEKQKRVIMASVTFLGAFMLSALLYLV